MSGVIQIVQDVHQSLSSYGISTPHQVLLASLVGNLLLYLFVMKILCKTILLPKFYNSLQLKDRNEYESRIISSIHSFVMGFVGGWILLNDIKFLSEWDFLHTSLYAECIFYYSTGYMIIDLLFVFYYYPQIGGIEMIIHHVCIAGAQIALVQLKVAQILGVWVTLTEHTTVFINGRWFLEKGGFKEAMIYVLNGLMMWLSWAIFRLGYVVFNILFFVHTWGAWMNYVGEKGVNGWIALGFWLLQCLNLAFLNIMWFTKLTKGIIKALSSKKSKKE
ncbi:predicted protein [Naegleria gruberi]|uniref:Predicted protein n=1 Tax=Naegleria gruberi TaxID=5762 RepID=D2VI63_NAEGR|nr:uncharacterized protein NAEGRDRAFT_68576 [Naegleria gruberi]EFC43538.1 predicted protein [Naegleria gruberi]|eukprot:XP_002676282.1 predicted protein [Naegleria gruberi strain NEG-M]